MNTGMISIKALLFGIFTLTLVGELQAEESAGTALEKSNLKKALYCMEVLENRVILSRQIG